MMRAKCKSPTGGYSYSVTAEQIRAWMRVPAARKLQWLEDVNRFLDKAMSRRAKRIQEMFRQGRL